MTYHPMEALYETRKWKGPYDDVPEGLAYFLGEVTASSTICNSGSNQANQCFRNGEMPDLLLDYELLEMGENPTSVCLVRRNMVTGQHCIGVCRERSIVYYIEAIREN